MPFSGRRMETNRLLALVDELAEMGVFDLTLAGGEPLLHPDILVVISRAINQGIRVGLLTNGVLLDGPMVDEMARTPKHQNFLVQVSIDSAEAAINNLTRGYTDRVIRNIRQAVEAGLEVQIACVLSKVNLAQAHLLIDAFYPAVKRYHFLNIQRTTSTLKRPELLLDEDEALGFWLHLNEYRKQFPEDLFLPSLRLQLRATGLADQTPEYALGEVATFDCASCSAGWTHVNIDAGFNVLGCDIAKDFTYMGSILDTSFEVVWHSDLAAKVREAKYPACYNIQNAEGEALRNELRPEYVNFCPSQEAMREPLRRRG